MTILATSKTTCIAGPDTHINCTRCGPGVAALTYQVEERMGVFFIPLITQRETYVKCARCGEEKLTSLSLEELASTPPDELDRYVYRRVSIVVKFLAIASLLLCCLPFASVILGMISFIASRRTGGWPRTLSLVGISIGSLISLATLAAMLNGS